MNLDLKLMGWNEVTVDYSLSVFFMGTNTYSQHQNRRVEAIIVYYICCPREVF